MQTIASPELKGANKDKSSSTKQSGKQPTQLISTNLKSVKAQKKKSKDPVIVSSTHRTTKQELVLSMLSHKAGTSIADITAKTDWQTHTVRGFLAGTVKKKLGLTLMSSKAAGDVRRYRIETRRSR